MSLHDKIGHVLSIGDCIVSVDRENVLFIGRVGGLHKTGSLKITRLTINPLGYIIYSYSRKTEQEMQIGDIVKSYDFVGIDTCYMVGQVVGVFRSDGTFRAKFIKRVWEGSEDKKFKTDYFTAPLQGEHFMDRDSSPRVVVIA